MKYAPLNEIAPNKPHTTQPGLPQFDQSDFAVLLRGTGERL